MLRVSRSRREEYGWSYLSDNDLSSFVVDAERRMAKFLAKTLIVCSGLVLLTHCILGQNGKWRKFAELLNRLCFAYYSTDYTLNAWCVRQSPPTS